MEQTQRSYKNVDTGKVFSMWTTTAGQNILIDSEGNQITGFYICAFTSSIVRLNNKKEVSLNPDEFYHLKQGEKATHRKFIGFKTFKKL